MEVFSGLEDFPQPETPRVLAVGTFDGVHLGHRAIVEEVIGRAKKRDSRSAALTFDPHPQRFLRRQVPPGLLSPSEEKAELLSQIGLDSLFVLRFDQKLALVEPEEFVEEILQRRLRVCEVVVGFSHRFGRERRGEPSLLRSLGHKLGFQVTVVEPVVVKGVVVSSTRIREALGRGEVEYARELLGRYYTLSGKVSSGERRGGILAYPTANIEVSPPEKLIPREGVYAVSADVGKGSFGGMMNIGVRPTFGESLLTVEAHLFDFNRDLYGRSIKVSLVRRMRDELKFESKEALRLQMEQDEKMAREILKGVPLIGDPKNS